MRNKVAKHLRRCMQDRDFIDAVIPERAQQKLTPRQAYRMLKKFHTRMPWDKRKSS